MHACERQSLMLSFSWHRQNLAIRILVFLRRACGLLLGLTVASFLKFFLKQSFSSKFIIALLKLYDLLSVK